MGFANKADRTRSGLLLDIGLRLLILGLAATWLILPPGRIAEPDPQAQAQVQSGR